MAKKGNSERIERYLRDQMVPEENEAFLNDLRNDKELREEAQMIALLIKDMKEEQAKQDAVIQQKILTSKRNLTAKTIRQVKWLGSIAAIFILIFGITLLWNKHSDEDALFNAYYSSYDMSLTRGGDDEAIKQELAELYNKLGGAEKDVTNIVSRLQIIYDGILSNNDDYSEYSYYKNDIAWYLALAYIKDHKPERAKDLLKSLADNGDNNAINLLKAISE